MKHLIRIIFYVLMIVILLPNCKKGENDPFISFRSRKARISGEWKLKYGYITSINNGITESTTYNGSTASNSSGIIPYSENWLIYKNGTFEIKCSDNNNTTSIYGYWNFSNKVISLGLKNKESIIFRVYSKITETNGLLNTENYSGTSCPMFTIIIDQLKNKKMVTIINGSSNWSTHTNTEYGTMTYEQ